MQHNTGQKRLYLSAGIAGIVVLLLYGWFISAGPWRARGYTSDYYSRMASAFRHGQLALEEEPNPALLALPDLYDPKARKGIPLLGDASIYEGKYYLYFGPFPSLILALITFILPVKPGDQVFAFIFTIGLFVIQSLFFVEIVRRYFKDLPGWIIPLGVIFLGVVGPFTKMLAHPYIHEAAISGAQFLATVGILFAFLALQDIPFDNRKLFLAGCFWTFAVATRTTQLVPIGFMTAVTWLFILYKSRKELGRRFITNSVSLLSPLLVGGVLLAWYNWARFDSIFEFGFYYQLAAFHLQENYSILFSRIYLVQNIYNYFFNPIEIRGAFPFLYPLLGPEQPVALSPELPKLYIVEAKFPGLLPSTPFLILAILPLFVLVGKAIHGVRSKSGGWIDHFDWNILNLTAALVGGSLPILLLFYAGFRYETEFITSLSMLALIGFCQGYEMFTKSMFKHLWIVLGVGVLVFSIVANIILAFTGMMS